MLFILFALMAYLMGSIPSGVIIGRAFYNKDIRNFGSKNIGATNAERVLGKKAGMIVTFLDILKVFIPSCAARHYLGIEYTAVIGIFGFLGHCFPVYTKFKGGKGVATYFGMLLAINIWLCAIVAIIWKLTKTVTKYVSISSMFSCLIAPFIYLYKFGLSNTFYVLLCCGIFIIYLHRTNIIRLLSGTENKVKS